MSLNYEIPNEMSYSLDQDITDYFYSYLSNKDIASFDKLTEIADITKRNLYITNDITSDTGIAIETMIRFFNQIDEQLGIQPADRVPIKVWINSGGGSVYAMLTAYDVIEMSKTPVITINQGEACSAAAIIFLAGHRRITFPHAHFLLHEGSASSGQLDAHKFHSYSNFYKHLLEQFKKIVLEKTNLSEEEYDKHSKDDWWIFATEAVQLKIADEIMEQNTYVNL